jgi:hypothetical protein
MRYGQEIRQNLSEKLQIMNNQKYIIALTSGLGNQMFQYALYVYLTQKKNYPQVKLYCWKKYLNEHNGLELTNIFSNINIVEKHSRIISWYIDLYFFVKKVLYVTGLKRVVSLFSWIMKPVPNVSVFPAWHTYQFVNEIRDVLINRIFIFTDFTDIRNIEICKIIKSTNSVSVHIRRGDYISNPKWRCSHGDICNLDYYNKAIDHIKRHVESPQFIVFSDDIEWGKNNLIIDNAIYVNWNTGIDAYRDMQLMALCKHNIIVNSTFSWWGGWLNQNVDKIVIAPAKWLNSHRQTNFSKFVFPEWIAIDNNSPNVSLILEENCSPKELEYILKQTYTDFEVTVPAIKFNIDDKRVKASGIHQPVGNHKFLVAIKEINLFRNKKYLSSKLLDYFNHIKK